jgi:type II secretory pathway pseudopilin PulG
MIRGKAFTLLELMTIVMIIGVLAAIAVPNFLEAQIRAKTTQTLTNQRLIAAALESYYVDYKAYPQNLALVDFKIVTEPRKPAGPRPASRIAHELGEGPPPELEGPWEPLIGNQSGLNPFGPPSATTESVRIAYAGWVMSKKIPKGFPTHRTFLGCSRCGSAAPLGTDRCFTCGSPLGAGEKTEIYSYSPNGSVLSALTTPVPYLPQQVNLDNFRSRMDRPTWTDRFPSPFLYVNFTQVNEEGLDFPGVPGKARYAIISLGPDLELQFVYRYPTPAFVIYDPTNGTISPGDIVTWHN